MIESRDIILADSPVFVLYRDEPEARPADELRADFYIPIEWEV